MKPLEGGVAERPWVAAVNALARDLAPHFFRCVCCRGHLPHDLGTARFFSLPGPLLAAAHRGLCEEAVVAVYGKDAVPSSEQRFVRHFARSLGRHTRLFGKHAALLQEVAELDDEIDRALAADGISV